MARRPKDIGTAYENRVLERYIQPVWWDAGRGQTQGSNDYGDFFNTSLGGEEMLNEAKDHKTWSLPSWLRTIYKKIEKRHGEKNWTAERPHPWALWFKQRPMRDLREDLCVMPAWLAAELLLCYTERHNHD